MVSSGDDASDRTSFESELGTVFAALPNPLLVVSGANRVTYVNPAAEQFFDRGASYLVGAALASLVPTDSALFSLIAQVRSQGASITEYDVALTLADHRVRSLMIAIGPCGSPDSALVVSLHEQSMARKINRQVVHRNAARSVTVLAAMLAHEVKSPLSGIRGAAQLLEQTANDQDRQLTRLICEETDRICTFVDRVGLFADGRPIERTSVNIHAVLDRVRRLAEAGFARHVRFHESYDPSLPPIFGNQDLLIQVFLNLVKNAAEAIRSREGEIRLTTAYRHGIRLAFPRGEGRTQLPLVVSVQDNGQGIVADIADQLFDPFVTTMPKGSGLGLALVAKVIGDHGGVVEFESAPRRTVFRVMLPVFTEPRAGAERRDR